MPGSLDARETGSRSGDRPAPQDRSLPDGGPGSGDRRGGFPLGAAVTMDELDGLTVTTLDWWFNLRPSNTEPLLRLNVEAANEARMAELRDEVLRIIAGPDAGIGENA